MANPFDQFDAAPTAVASKSSNPFDQFDGHATAKPETTLLQGIGNFAKGGLVGFSDLGSNAIDLGVKATGGLLPKLDQWNRTRHADLEYIDDKYKDSPSFSVGRIGGNIASTYPVGGALGAGAKSLGASPAIVNSLATSGMRAGTTPGALNTLTRIAGGATTGGVSSALINPDSAGTGAVVGGAIPIVGSALSGLASMRGGAAEKLMQSAIKPTIAQLKSGDADTAVKTLLQYGINPTKGGVDKLRDAIDGINNEIKSKIANSTATVDKQKVLDSLGNVRDKFSKQVSPTSDLNAIQSVADDFAAHPSLSGNDIPVQMAQELKQGTYKILAKKYGQLGNADTEAQKGLARGLKEGVSGAVPGIDALNSQESKLITTLGVSERRALMELNKNPMGLAALAQSPSSWAMFMADKSALFKSIAARMINPSDASTQGQSIQKLSSIAAKSSPSIIAESKRGN